MSAMVVRLIPRALRRARVVVPSGEPSVSDSPIHTMSVCWCQQTLVRPRDSPSTGGIKLASPRGTCLCTRCSCVSVQGETR